MELRSSMSFQVIYYRIRWSGELFAQKSLGTLFKNLMLPAHIPTVIFDILIA